MFSRIIARDVNLIYIDTDGNTIAPSEKELALLEKNYDFSDKIKDIHGYSFMYVDTINGEEVSGSSLPASDKNIIFVYSKENRVIYDGNGNTSGTAPVDTSIYKNGDSVTVLDKFNLEKNGSKFVGWNTKKDNSGTSYSPGDEFFIYDTITLFAQWKPLNNPWIDWMVSGNGEIKSKKIDHIWYIQGYPDKTVQPNGTITKAEVITAIDRLYELDGSYKKMPYEDVENIWYKDQIQRAYNTDLIDSSDFFKPNEPILRSEVLEILKKLENLGSKELFEGYEDGTMKLEQTITRAEFIKSINNVLNRKCTLNFDNPYIDINENDWYYRDIIEASFTHQAQ